MAESERLFWIVLVAVAWLGLSLWSGYRHRKERFAAQHGSVTTGGEAGDVLVAYASQSGTAARLARSSAEALGSSFTVRLMSLNEVDDRVLSSTQRAVFIASTYGEGEPPDNGVVFYSRFLKGQAALDLSHLEFAVLALGDRAYKRFCAFGRSLQQGLELLGARPLCGLTEADRSELASPDMLPSRWREELSRLAPGVERQPPHSGEQSGEGEITHWTISDRKCLNPNSAGLPIYHLWLTPVTAMPTWKAGDIIEVRVRNSVERCRQWLAQWGMDGNRQVICNGVIRSLACCLGDRQLPAEIDASLRACLENQARPEEWLKDLPWLPWREYSAASVASEGTLQLLIRLRLDERGEPGLGCGWLTQQAGGDDLVTIRVRSNPAFHGPEPQRAMIMIGAGSGLAGLRAHLAERAANQGSGRNWLFFGERSPVHDRFLDDELTSWLDTNHLTLLDRVFSRDPDAGVSLRYVQDLLWKYREDVRRWVAEGAAIYVCGSLSGMGEGVHAALVEILGQEALERLLVSGLYRRDVY